MGRKWQRAIKIILNFLIAFLWCFLQYKCQKINLFTVHRCNDNHNCFPKNIQYSNTAGPLLPPQHFSTASPGDCHSWEDQHVVLKPQGTLPGPRDPGLLRVREKKTHAIYQKDQETHHATMDYNAACATKGKTHVPLFIWVLNSWHYS